MKECSGCREWKPLDDFQMRARSKDGRDRQCRACRKAWYDANAELHKARVLARNQRYRKELYRLMTDYLLAHPCVDCGETDVRCLEFDHRPGEAKFRDVARMISNSLPWKRILAEIAKCDVRCANCHRRRTNERGGFWRQGVYEETAQQLTERSVARLENLFA